jgi:DNA repair protein RadC
MSAPATAASAPIPLTVTVLADATEPVGSREAEEEDPGDCGCRTVKDPAGLTVVQVQAQLRPLGIVLRKKDAYGDFRVNYRGGSDSTAYHTPDLDDALATGLAMARRAGGEAMTPASDATAAAPIPAGLREASDYEGWKNRETWTVNLWANNDPAIYRLIIDHPEAFTAHSAMALARRHLPRSGEVAFLGQPEAWAKIDWNEIAKEWNVKRADVRNSSRGLNEAPLPPPPDPTGDWALVQRMMDVYVSARGLGQYVHNSALPTGKLAADGSGVWSFYTRRGPTMRQYPKREPPMRHEVDDSTLRRVYAQRGLSEAGEAGGASESIVAEATEYGVSWQQRRDGVWMARGTGGIYYMLPTPSGMYQTIWMSDTGANQQDLGMHTFASGAQAVSRYVPDVGRMRQIAPERAAEAGEAMELQWERSGGGTGWRGEGRAGTYLLRHVLGKTTGTDDTGWWNLHVSGRQYGPYPSLDAAKRAAAHMDGFAGEAAAPSVQAQAPSGVDYDVSYYDPKIKQWRSKTVRLSVAPGDVHREAARVLGMDAGSIVVVAARSYLVGAGELAARADWDIHIVDPRTRKVRTERLNVPGTDASMGDTNAAAYVASKKFKVDQRYILALPHRERSEFAAEQAPYVEQGQVCRPWVRMEKDPLAFNACMKLADKVGPIEGHDRLHEILRQYMERQDQEVLVAIVLGTHLELRAMSEISRGGRDRVPTPMPDIARLAAYQAVHYGGMALGIAHTHPSGKPRPSQADREVTRAVEDVCAALGILFVDHLVIGSIEHGYYSFKSGKIHRPRRAR